MRYIATILIVLVGFLCIQPALVFILENQKTICCSDCCTKAFDTEQQEESSDEDCPNACNPFQSCTSCTGYTLAKTSFKINQITVKNTPQHISKEQAHSQFSPDFWQPPKLS